MQGHDEFCVHCSLDGFRYVDHRTLHEFEIRLHFTTWQIVKYNGEIVSETESMSQLRDWIKGLIKIGLIPKPDYMEAFYPRYSRTLYTPDATTSTEVVVLEYTSPELFPMVIPVDSLKKGEFDNIIIVKDLSQLKSQTKSGEVLKVEVISDFGNGQPVGLLVHTE